VAGLITYISPIMLQPEHPTLTLTSARPNLDSTSSASAASASHSSSSSSSSSAANGLTVATEKYHILFFIFAFFRFAVMFN
jgi:hypothetical protein